MAVACLKTVATLRLKERNGRSSPVQEERLSFAAYHKESG